MAEESTGEPGSNAEATTPLPGGSQTKEADLGVSEGQSPATGERTTERTQSATVSSFFDPKDIEGKPELQAAYKQMQAAYTKKMQAISEQNQKIAAYDAFAQDPLAQIQKVASQMGYKLTRAQAEQLNEKDQGQWEPKSWDDVMAMAEERAEQRILRKLGPVLNQVHSMRKSTIESQLMEIDPTWQQYEDQMQANLRAHPTLVNDPATLYRLSVPAEVIESRATQRALKKLEAKAQSSKVSGKSTTNRTQTSGLPDGPVSFQDAVNAARKKLADEGIRPQ